MYIYTYMYIYMNYTIQIRSFFWSVFSCIRTEYEPEKPPYLDNFHTVNNLHQCILGASSLTILTR